MQDAHFVNSRGIRLRLSDVGNHSVSKVETKKVMEMHAPNKTKTLANSNLEFQNVIIIPLIKMQADHTLH